MNCPKCKANTLIYSTFNGNIVERFRKCTKCGHKFTTYEHVDCDPCIFHFQRYLIESGEYDKFIPQKHKMAILKGIPPS